MSDEINWMPGMRAPRYYVLTTDHRVVEMLDREPWTAWTANIDNRRVANTEIGEDITVSTVFLGLDHRFGGGGPPLLFETLVFGGDMDDTMRRYSSWDDAVIGHEVMVRKVHAAMKKPAESGGT